MEKLQGPSSISYKLIIPPVNHQETILRHHGHCSSLTDISPNSEMADPEAE